MLGTTLLVILIMILIGMLPGWPHTTRWGFGFYPSGGLFVVVVILLFLLLAGRI